MGLFRRAKKKREKAAAEPPTEPATTAEAQAEPATTAEAQAEPATTAEPPREPARTAEPPRTAEAPTEVAPRKVTAEARPNPDEPGWGQALGQQIGKARNERAGQQ